MSERARDSDQIFARPPHYTLHLRGGGRRAQWSFDARPDYNVLFLLEGALSWRTGGDSSRGDHEATGGVATTSVAEVEDVAQPGGVTEASGVAEVSGIVKTGDALLVAPGETLYVKSSAASETLLLSLAPAHVLDCAARSRLTRSDALITFRHHAADDDPRLARAARDMCDELLEDSAGREVVLAALVEQATVHLLRRHAHVRRAAEMELSRAGLVDRRIRRAVELMHSRLERDLPLEEIASAAHLSPFHFARLFKKLTGATPHAYLAQLRAERARALLAETDLSITEVASRVGYMSPSHFAKAFRQASGLSPRAFRKALVRR
ncbi:MAG TPA: AraC family transcriptional regulator [Pyrinomonadaceae bacterium]|nr:AraC family transcriptional regulator [Pyrinomonadaceae bacterium]